jgi:thiazole/oxazole-forming peptide maturase SagD family component
VKIRTTADPADQIARHRRRLYSPLCGLVTSVGYSLRTTGGPQVYVAGGDLCGVHALLDQDAPKAGSYHIGGSGVLPFEPEIRVYAEAAERYASAVAVLTSDLPTRWASYEEMLSLEDGHPVLDRRHLRFGGTGRAPYDAFTDDAPLTWILAPTLWPVSAWGSAGADAGWIPSQLFYVGYRPRRHEGEPWLQAAVTTGTAVHTSVAKAWASAAYEIIQVDATMGHWYGSSEALRIVPDLRTRRLDGLLARHTRKSRYEFEFYHVPSPDLPDFSVACVIAAPSGEAPVVSVGLGADASLERAMYKAFLEGSGVRTLAEWGLLSQTVTGAAPPSPESMFDLDTNVSYYASPGHGEAVLDRFRNSGKIYAADLPPDVDLPDPELARHLLQAFRRSGKDLYHRDITPSDVASAGFRAVRLWCPQTLSLCLPSAPPVQHPRFADYGGFSHSEPHPYP